MPYITVSTPTSSGLAAPVLHICYRSFQQLAFGPKTITHLPAFIRSVFDADKGISPAKLTFMPVNHVSQTYITTKTDRPWIGCFQPFYGDRQNLYWRSSYRGSRRSKKFRHLGNHKKQMDNFSLCLAASGCGHQTNIQMPTLQIGASSGSTENAWYESLELTVGFGLIDFFGFCLMHVPEPFCQISGFVLSVPSKAIWVYQTYILTKRWMNKPRK